MIKAHLDAAQLEKDFKADELRDLASALGLDTRGKKEELAARIAAVEVDVEEEHKLTADELKEIKALEAAAAAGATPPTNDGVTPPTDNGATPPATAPATPAGAVNVVCTKTYNDLQLKRLVKKGESYAVASKERADYLASKGFVEYA